MRLHAHRYANATSQHGYSNPMAANGYSGYYEHILDKVTLRLAALVAGVPFLSEKLRVDA
jgi:hypothetical protein